MLNYFDKAGFVLIAGGVLGQFFVATDTKVVGCVATHVATGIWEILLPNPISKPNYMFLSGLLTGYNPGLVLEMTDLTTTTKQIQIKDTATAALVDADVSFMMFEISPP
jgi:hypothetical protein